MGRIKLCAIAKNEGAYLADWISHHLHFGFDGIEVSINGTTDRSVAVLRRIGSAVPHIEFSVRDRLLADSLATGKSFQFRAYARMAARARRQGYSHVAFLDLDEYWLPRDFASSVHSFVPADADVNVVSFPWLVDVPDPHRPRFASLIDPLPRLQADPHVKSIVALDDRVRQFRTHTARTHSGGRLLIREPFPMVDERAQQWGSLITQDHLIQRHAQVPEAFVLHMMHRSSQEYVACLGQGLRQTGQNLNLKSNRSGFVPRATPMLDLSPHPEAITAYRAARDRFRVAVDVDRLTLACQQQRISTAESLIDAATVDFVTMGQLKNALRGVVEPRLDHAYPGWDTPLKWHIDSTERRGESLLVAGWAVGVDQDAEIEFALEDAAGQNWPAPPAMAMARPDVVDILPGAPVECGFLMEVPVGQRCSFPRLKARQAGHTFWDVRQLAIQT